MNDSRTAGSWFYFDPSEVDKSSAVRLLRETLRETAGPMDAMIDRIAQDDGPAFFSRAIETLCPAEWSDPAGLSGASLPADELTGIKNRVKPRIDADTLDDDSIAALCAYCATVALARALHGVQISSVSEDRWAPVFSELADLLSKLKPWASIFTTAHETCLREQS